MSPGPTRSSTPCPVGNLGGVPPAPFSAPVRDWFGEAFGDPTPAQAQGWPEIVAGGHTLILAPTGSGKTLAAFLAALDRLAFGAPAPVAARRTRVLYVSPLKALAVDVEKNLRAPLAGIVRAAERAGAESHDVRVGMRTGDTPGAERQAMLRRPPDILITTPESLYLMLTSRARDTLRAVETVIVDEIHAVAGTKRGAHLALSLERLEEITARPPQRIGLSATQRPLEEIARFLGGHDGTGTPRPVSIVDAGTGKDLDIEVVVPVDDLSAPGETAPGAAGDRPSTPGPGEARAGIWPHVYPRLLDLILSHRSTIVFVNSRRLAERLAERLNTMHAGTGDPGDRPPLVRAHHGSVSREQRLAIEDDLKAGRLRGLVATSSLELGIDMGAVDLVVQVESPRSVARGLQRVGRAGHRIGEPSRGKVFPKHPGDLLEAAVVVRRMREGRVEETRIPRNPLDVLAQQVVAACALDEWAVDELLALVRRAANYHELSPRVFEAVLDMLAGRYPSDEFSGLRPRIVWDRLHGRVRGREGAQRLAVTNGGTIPDRGLFGVFLPDGARVGELDEEMVYEARPGDTFVLGASTWRIHEITHDRVVVVPAPGEGGSTPFWHGDGPGRPLELGRAVGATVRELRAAGPETARRLLRRDAGLDERAASNLLRYLADQAEATGTVPDDRTVVVERFPDEIGDWRVCVLSPFGARVHAPWAMCIEHTLGERFGSPVPALWSDDGIVVRLPEAVEAVPTEALLVDPDDAERIVAEHLPSTALFASRFREAAGRSLLLPRRAPGRRTPLWQQRQRSADLLDVASRHPSFPILLETDRECMQDVFDLPALREVLSGLRSRAIRAVAVDTPHASPFARSLLFGWIAVYMYEGDAPLAERRAAALSLDRELLRELLGDDELRELLDPAVVAEVELELQRLAEGSRRARGPDDVHDLLRELGDLTVDEIGARCAPPLDGPGGGVGAQASAWVDSLVDERRAIRIRIAGEARVAAAEDAARFRDALGAAVPRGLPGSFTEPVAAPLDDLVARYARTHGPFTALEVARRLGLDPTAVGPPLRRLVEAGRLVEGRLHPGGTSREWCDAGVLRRLRRRSLAVLRHEVEPVDPVVLARFLPAWQGVGRPDAGVDALLEAVDSIAGAAVPASSLEADVLASRVARYRGRDLDALCGAGELVWVGAGAIGRDDGRVVLLPRDRLRTLHRLADPDRSAPPGPVHDAIRGRLAGSGASFWPDLVAAAGPAATEAEVLAALWDLVWAGEVTNDSLAPLRAVLSGALRRRTARGRPRPGRLTRLGPPAGAGRWSLVVPPGTPVASPTERVHAWAEALLGRHGVLAREAVRAEGVDGGFAAVYPVLKAMEEAGRARRGYFVAGLGAAQFALPGAVDRLRSQRDASGTDPGGWVTLAATDPAQPYGAALRWPETPEGSPRPSRSAGAFVVLTGGDPVGFLDRGGRSLATFGAPAEAWVEALVDLVKGGRLRSVDLVRIDATTARESPHAAALRAAGFRDSYRGLVLR